MTSLGADEQIQQLNMFTITHCLSFGFLVYFNFVVHQVYRNPRIRNTTNLLILNLAVADLLFLLVCVPATASDYILMYWPFGLTWCRTVQYIIYVTAYVSIYTLVLMAADRYESVLQGLLWDF